MELNFDKYCVIDGSPTTVLPVPRRRSKVSNRKSSGKPKNGDEVLSRDQEFADIKFNRYRSASCRDVRPRRSNQEGNDLLKRGSVYQSSKEVTFLKKADDVNERKKIEFSRENASTFSFGIIDSLCNFDEDSSLVERNRSSVMSQAEQSTSSSKAQIDLRPRGSTNCTPMSSQERDMSVGLHNSLSAKLALPHLPARSESDGSKPSRPKARFSPVRKMFEPFAKSKSHRSPLGCVNESGSEITSAVAGNTSNKTISISLLNDLPNKPHNVEYNSQCDKQEKPTSALHCSPAHLHGVLKLDNKNEVPCFEFRVKSPEDIFVAKASKVENALTWSYTFHSLHQRRKSNASGWGFKERSKDPTLVGRMNVSCYLCTELKGAGVFNDSMVTEYVLYDVAHSRRSVSSQDSSSCSPDVVRAPSVSHEISSSGNCEKNEPKIKGQFESSPTQPQATAELNPELQIAAVVMQVPFEKRESLKINSADRKMDEPLPNLLETCKREQAKESISASSCPGKMHVVIPAGNHSLPSTESRGPSPLLDRWRLGGGCDCGGWDMACPLNVLENPNIKIAEGQMLMHEHFPAELFVQGRKDNVPAFSMRLVEDGKYAVDFHAQLSSLQAFSICVAILHAAEASTALGRERSKEMWQSDSLRVFAEEEIKNLIEVIAEEEKIKVDKQKTVENLPSFVVNPPFSPIARV